METTWNDNIAGACSLLGSLAGGLQENIYDW